MGRKGATRVDWCGCNHRSKTLQSCCFFFKANYAHLCFKKEEVALVLKRVVGASETQVAADVTRHLSAPLTPSACNHSDANTSSTVSSRQVAHRHKYVIFAIKQMTHRIYNDINRRCFSSLNWVGWFFPPPDPVLPVRLAARCCACVPATFTTCHTVVYFTRGQRELSFTCVNAASEALFDSVGWEQEENNTALLWLCSLPKGFATDGCRHGIEKDDLSVCVDVVILPLPKLISAGMKDWSVVGKQQC